MIVATNVKTAFSVIKIGLTAAVLAFVASMISLAIVLNHLEYEIETGLWIRVTLVTVALLATALFWQWRLPRNQSRGLTLFAGLMLGLALNPLSWMGRAYAGQLWFDTGVPSGAADVLFWAFAAAIAAAIGQFVQLRVEQA